MRKERKQMLKGYCLAGELCQGGLSSFRSKNNIVRDEMSGVNKMIMRKEEEVAG